MTLFVQIVFGILALAALGTATMAVSVRNLIHSALWLIASFFTLAALYLLMEAEFISLVQVLIYVGSVSVLILFAIMLTRDVEGEKTAHLLYQRWQLTALIAVGLFALLIAPTVYNHPWPGVQQAQAGAAAPQVLSTVDLAKAFLGTYLLPFEVASVLLLVALVGAVMIAFEQGGSRRRVRTLAEQVAERKARAAAPAAAAQPAELDKA